MAALASFCIFLPVISHMSCSLSAQTLVAFWLCKNQERVNYYFLLNQGGFVFRLSVCKNKSRIYLAITMKLMETEAWFWVWRVFAGWRNQWNLKWQGWCVWRIVQVGWFQGNLLIFWMMMMMQNSIHLSFTLCRYWSVIWSYLTTPDIKLKLLHVFFFHCM